MSGPAIAARGLRKAYGRVVALEGFDLEVGRGEIVGLVGPDGAGKTTALRLLCGILDADGGSAEVAGHDVARAGEAARRRLGYMSQRFSLYGDLTVGENLGFFGRLHRVPPPERLRREAELLEFSRLGPHRGRLAQDLSGGMRQKLALACTLLHAPEVLLLDEPTTGVDPVSRREFWRILYDLNRRGTAILVSTPYLDEAERCHRVALIHQGRVRVADAPAALRERMRGGLIEVTARPQRLAKEELARHPAVLGIQVFGDRLHVWVRGEAAAEGGLCAHLAARGVTACEQRPIAPGLEDVFVSLLTEDLPEARRGQEPAPAPAPPPRPEPERWREAGAPVGAGRRAGTDGVAPRQDPGGHGPTRTGAQGEGAPAVEVEGLVRRFGGFTAVAGLSFSVARGEIFGFLGPNGAGKSTTIRMLCGIIAPTAGRGRVAGLDIAREAEGVKARIGYMSQRFSLYDDLTVAENIEFYGGVYGVGRARLAERRRWILAMANLEERAGSLARELSVGWKQRLALGCAVVHEPEILFLDEPTSGVDPLSRRVFWDLIYTVAGGGVTVFVTTHAMDEAEHCDRLGLIHGGRLAALGTPAELKARYATGTLLEVRAEPLAAALAALAAAPAARAAAVFGAGLHVAVSGPEESAAVREELERAGVAVLRIEPVRPTLEDVFVRLVESEDRRAARA